MATCRAEGAGTEASQLQITMSDGPVGPSVLMVRLRTSLRMWFPVITSLRL